MRAWILSFQFMVAVVMCLPVPVYAYSFSPSLVTLRASGSDSSAFFRLENKGMKPTAVEITIHEHNKDIDGKTIPGAPADDDFIIFPAQLVMTPGDEVGVQVRWIGDPALSAERAYTLLTREIPIPRKPADESSAGIRIEVTVLMNYEGRIYVTPQGAKPKVVVESVTEHPQAPEGNPGATESAVLEVVLMNQGTAHQAMATLSLVVTPLSPTGTLLKQHAVKIAASKIQGMTPHLLAGERRRLRTPRPAGLPAGPVQVLLSD
jgi:fimbrial chaperone protein